MSFFHDSQTPQIAQRLLALFTPTEIAECLLGDLLEEFSGRVTEAGITPARRWYWRQTLTTVWHTGGHALRAAPLRMLITVIGGFWLVGFATRSSVHAMQTLLDAHRIYELHPNAYLFWFQFPLKLGRGTLCMAVGALVAVVAKRMEMAAVVALALVQIALFLIGTAALIASGSEWFHWFIAMLPWNALSSIGVVVGGALVKSYRTSVIKRISRA